MTTQTITRSQAAILKAITDNTTVAGQWLSLSLVRDETGLLRADFDAAMTGLAIARLVTLAPEDNQKTLTSIDHRNALRIGGEDKHLVTLG